MLFIQLLCLQKKFDAKQDMIEYQGWATIREAFCEEKEDEAALAMIASKLETLVGELAKRALCEATFRNINGALRLSVMGFRNHASGDWPDVMALFEWIAANAPGSYGTLSCHDDEDAEGRENEFQLFVLRRGTLTRSHDPHLSPYFPKVEDPPQDSPFFRETLDETLIREVIRPMGLRDLGKGRYTLDMFRDYRFEIEVGEATDFEGDEPEVAVFLTLHCPRYGQVMDRLLARRPEMFKNKSGKRSKEGRGDVLRLGLVTFYRHDGRFQVSSFKDHLGNLREKRFDVRAHLEQLAAISKPAEFLNEYTLGLSNQVLTTLSRFWAYMFLCLECEMSPAAVMDLFDSPDFAQTKKSWRLKEPLDTAHVKEMMDVFVPWDSVDSDE
nr:Imm7 family immunity protein [Aliiroseovarius subalbicans]